MTINFNSILKLLRQNLPVVLSFSLVGLIALISISFLAVPKYTSTVRLFVSTPANTLDLSSLSIGSSFAQQRVKSYADIINSPLTLNPVIQNLGLSISAYELASMISARAPIDTVLIDVSVVTTDPILSANIANAVGQQFEITASQLEFGDSATGIKVTVVGDAVPSSTPSSPRYLLNSMAGLVLGFLFGFGVAVIRLYFSGVVKNSDHMSGTPMLATVGFDPEAKAAALISSINKYSARTESYRQLRTSIIHHKEIWQSGGKSGGFVLTITSSLPGEGKTTSALNLGMSLTASGKKVLYVEGDLRRPSAKIYFSQFTQKSRLGFSTILKKTENSSLTYSKMIRRDVKSGLHLMLAGEVPENAGELIMNNEIVKFLNYARKKYEYILIDTPPVLPVSDSLSLARLSDGVFLVVRAGSTRIAQLQGVIAKLRAIGIEPVGALLNMIPEDARDYDDYGYRYEYGKYGYRGYRYRKYKKDYGYDYGYSAGSGYVPKTYPPTVSESLRLEISKGKNK
jgi:non-specific protein-tyrosine kinase